MNKQTKINKQIKWLIERSGYLSIYKIEKELGMSEGTLKKFVDGKRGLPENWHKPLTTWVKNFKK